MPPGRRGFPPHRGRAGSSALWPASAQAPAHQLGFNDLKAIEIAGFVDALAGRGPEPFNFRKGLHIQALVGDDPGNLRASGAGSRSSP